MKVFDLQCEWEHVFEGWFANDTDFVVQKEKMLLQCPVCNSLNVHKRLSTPYLHKKSNRVEKSAITKRILQGAGEKKETFLAEQPIFNKTNPSKHNKDAEQSKLQAVWLKKLRKLSEKAENVGDDFANEARKIHEGLAPERAIRGQAKPQEVMELLEDDIPILPLPSLANKTLQ